MMMLIHCDYRTIVLLLTNLVVGSGLVRFNHRFSSSNGRGQKIPKAAEKFQIQCGSLNDDEPCRLRSLLLVHVLGAFATTLDQPASALTRRFVVDAQHV